MALMVKNGRLVLNEPTDLPEGEVVYARAVFLDELSAAERQVRLTPDFGSIYLEHDRFFKEPK